MNNLSGQRIFCASLKSQLGPVLEEWRKIHWEYKKGQSEDALYFYNEIATLSTFAGALWRHGHLVLQEYAAYKGPRQNKPGRADIWFRLGCQELVAEAKQRWPRRLNNDAVESAFTAAIGDAEETQKVGRRLALAIITPSLPKEKSDKAEGIIRDFIEILKKTKCAFLAYEFRQPESPTWKDRLYPGVVLLGQLID